MDLRMRWVDAELYFLVVQWWTQNERIGLIGEVYVLNDGGEADLDLGNYERYLDVTLSKDHNITTGKVYQHVIEREVSYSRNQKRKR